MRSHKKYHRKRIHTKRHVWGSVLRTRKHIVIYTHTCTFIHITSHYCVKSVDKTGTIRVFGSVSNVFWVGDRLTGALLPDEKRENNKKVDQAITN